MRLAIILLALAACGGSSSDPPDVLQDASDVDVQRYAPPPQPIPDACVNCIPCVPNARHSCDAGKD